MGGERFAARAASRKAVKRSGLKILLRPYWLVLPGPIGTDCKPLRPMLVAFDPAVFQRVPGRLGPKLGPSNS
jgi:hypothetical protein